MRKKQKTSLLSILIIIAALCYFVPQYWQQITQNQLAEALPSGSYRVVRVVDGDTIVISYQGKEEKVRLIGVDTPESVHSDASKNTPYGKIASDYTKAQLTGKTIQLEFDVQERDKYGRLLAYVYVDGKMYNKTLLEEGHAKVATFPPNVKYVEEFQQLEQKAQEEQIGMWQDYAPKTSGNLIGNKNSQKYHQTDCQGAKKISNHNKVWFDTEEEAAAAGYQPCAICFP